MTTHDDQPHYTLSELTDEAGVSVRTVRYYIAEGLLPPPITAGPRSSYTQAHLDRLRLIDRMKAAYLPLKEIRRRLTALDDHEIHRLAQSDTPPTPASLTLPPDSASSYIARLIHRPSPAARAKPAAPPQVAMRGQHVLDDQDPVSYAQPLNTVAPSRSALPPTTEDSTWRRISLTDDAELLIRNDTYQRKRDRVDWLVGWAKKVFG
jgi:DNA-binding transcriptional MerR regulator